MKQFIDQGGGLDTMVLHSTQLVKVFKWRKCTVNCDVSCKSVLNGIKV